MDKHFSRAIKLAPQVIEYLSTLKRLEARKAAPVSRDELERRLARAIQRVDNRYLGILRDNNGQTPFGYWDNYQRDLAEVIASPIRASIEQSFAESSDYARLVDSREAASNIDKAVTAAIAAITLGIITNTRNAYNSILQEGVTGAPLLERIALRFSSGHAEAIAVTELTRAEASFADVLSGLLSEQGIKTQQRWLTSEDERVCPICTPADHKLKDEPINTASGGWNGQTWGQRYPNGAPAHPHCRCKINVEIVK